MRKYFLVTLVAIGLVAGLYVASMNRGACPLKLRVKVQKIEYVKKDKQAKALNDALALLKNRKDKDALAIFEKILLTQLDNLDALWGKAEVLRRSRNYNESENLLKKILCRNPQHISSLISLAYIRYKDDQLSEALRLINQVLAAKNLVRENQALAYMMLGSINSRRSAKGWLFSKVLYGTQIKGYFLRAKELAPDLPEVHLGLGTFYLLAPAIVGGNLDKAFAELGLAIKIAPDFATANARLAQAYKKKGLQDKYNFYINRARILDPKNEILREIVK